MERAGRKLPTKVVDVADAEAEAKADREASGEAEADADIDTEDERGGGGGGGAGQGSSAGPGGGGRGGGRGGKKPRRRRRAKLLRPPGLAPPPASVSWLCDVSCLFHLRGPRLHPMLLQAALLDHLEDQWCSNQAEVFPVRF